MVDKIMNIYVPPASISEFTEIEIMKNLWVVNNNINHVGKQYIYPTLHGFCEYLIFYCTQNSIGGLSRKAYHSRRIKAMLVMIFIKIVGNYPIYYL